MAKVKQLHIDIIESQIDSDDPEQDTEPEEEDAEVSTDCY